MTRPYSVRKSHVTNRWCVRQLLTSGQYVTIHCAGDQLAAFRYAYRRAAKDAA